MEFDLELSGIEHAFGRTVAVQSASIALSGGEIVGLIGENGSGKSTLAKILCGFLRPDRGSIRIDGSTVRFRHPRDAQRLGIAMLPQFAELCGDLSVAENISLGAEPMRALGFGWIDRKAMASIATEFLEEFGGGRISPSAPAAGLSGGQKKAVILARLLRKDPRILVLDEPSASLGVEQRRSMHAIIRRLREEGRALVLISHDIDEVASLCDRVCVMHAGKITAILDRQNLDRQELLHHMSSAVA
jgi:ABC-type sugar transport system ATPase subunit